MKKEINETILIWKERIKKLNMNEWVMLLIFALGLYVGLTNKSVGSGFYYTLLFQGVFIVFFMKRKMSSEMMVMLIFLTPYIYGKLTNDEYLKAIFVYLLLGFVFYFYKELKKNETQINKVFKKYIVVTFVIALIAALFEKIFNENLSLLEAMYFQYLGKTNYIMSIILIGSLVIFQRRKMIFFKKNKEV